MKDIILPNYENCILNTITSILKYYNVKTEHKSLKELDEILQKKYRNIAFIVLDGMGEHILTSISTNGFFKKNEVKKVTSVYPSTTTAALTTYYAGKPPYETGWIAWSQYFKEYGRAVDMLSHIESYKHESIKDAKIDVFKEIVNYKTIFEQIEEASNIKAYEIMPSYSDRRAKRTIRADSIDEIVDNILMLDKNPEEKFVMAYSDNPDGLLHKYGTDSVEVADFIKETENKIQKMCEKLSEDTIVIISADHGHKNINNHHTILDYEDLQECFLMPPALESRCLTFWIKSDMKKEFEKRFKEKFSEEFWLMTKKEFLEKNFLGFGKKHKKIDEFLGDYIALSISDSMINLETYLAPGKPLKKSTHCGLTKEEMEVPVIVIKN